MKAKVSSKVNKYILIMIASFSLLGAFLIPKITTPVVERANAGFNWCSDLGPGLVGYSRVNTDITLSNEKGRKWTAEELFSGSLSYGVYTGEGKGNWFLADTGDRGNRDGKSKAASLWKDQEVKNLLQSSSYRQEIRCMFAGSMNLLPDFFLSGAGMFTNISKGASNNLFNSNFICEDPYNPTGGCINIAGAVGGTSKTDSGLIGSMATSIYFPLSVLAALFLAIHLIYKGLIKRQFREGMQDLFWSIGAFMLGVILLLNPSFLAKIPQGAANVISTCLVAGLNGENCMSEDGTKNAISSMVGTECLSSTADSKSSETFANGLNCGIWKTFVLEPWAQGQFGVSYKELYTKDPPVGGKIWTALPKDGGNDYCIHLGTSGSADSYKNSAVELTQGDIVCNVALYQLYVKTKAYDSALHKDDYGGVISGDYTSDRRMYDVLLPIAKEKSNFGTWAAAVGGSSGRGGLSFLAMLSSLIAGVVLLIFSIFGLMYKVAGTMLMAFSPMFFLLALHPGRGKKIFLGWLESVVSSVLKFFASALLVLIGLSLYASVIGSASPMNSFIGVIIISALLVVYRKEIVNLIGQTNMGGQKLSNKVGNAMGKAGKGLKNSSSALVGGGIGGVMAGGGIKEVKLDKNGNAVLDKDGNAVYQNQALTTMKRFAGGGSDSLTRDLKRGRGVVAQTLKQRDRVGNTLEQKQLRDMETIKQTQEKMQAEELRQSTERGKTVTHGEDRKNYIQNKYGTMVPEQRRAKKEELIAKNNKRLEEKRLAEKNVVKKQAKQDGTWQKPPKPPLPPIGKTDTDDNEQKMPPLK